MKVNSYDSKSYELALLFLKDEPVYRDMLPDQQKDIVHRLSCDIQTAIEDFLQELCEGPPA